MREVLPHDLELYAVNTGEFYRTHLALVGKNDAAWRLHVSNKVVPHYCREIEPVMATQATIAIVAARMREYYERHAREQ